jgi:hypothetical protein
MGFFKEVFAKIADLPYGDCIRALRRISEEEKHRRGALRILNSARKARGEEPLRELDPRILAIYRKRVWHISELDEDQGLPKNLIKR